MLLGFKRGVVLVLIIFTNYLWADSVEDDDINYEPLTGVVESLELEGTHLKFNIKLKLEESYHAYQEKFKISVPDYEVQEVLSSKLSPVVEFFDIVSNQNKLGVENSAHYTGELILKDPKIQANENLKLAVNYQACRADVCLFEVDLTLEHPVKIIESPWYELDFKKAQNKGWLLVFLVAFLAGFLVSLTPCIFPMIPITLAVIGSKNSTSRCSSFLLSLVYVLGIATTYSIMGVTAAMTGQLFGNLLGHPVAIVIISLIFFVMALSMYGLFDLNFLPMNFGGEKMMGGMRSQKLKAYFNGILAGLIASPCVGPVLIAILTYVANTQNVVLGFFLLFTYALGFGVLILVLGTYSGILNKIPKAGPWMNFSKFIFGTTFLALSLYYARPLIIKYWPESENHAEVRHSDLWQEFSEEKIQEAKNSGKPVVIDFYADWCAACLELEKFTFSDAKVKAYATTIMWLRVNATTDTEDLKELKRKYHVLGLPTVVFINGEASINEELTLNNFEKTEQFIKRLERVLK